MRGGGGVPSIAGIDQRIVCVSSIATELSGLPAATPPSTKTSCRSATTHGRARASGALPLVESSSQPIAPSTCPAFASRMRSAYSVSNVSCMSAAKTSSATFSGADWSSSSTVACRLPQTGGSPWICGRCHESVSMSKTCTSDSASFELCPPSTKKRGSDITSTAVHVWPKRLEGMSPCTSGASHTMVTESSTYRSIPPPMPPQITIFLSATADVWRERGGGVSPVVGGCDQLPACTSYTHSSLSRSALSPPPKTNSLELISSAVCPFRGVGCCVERSGWFHVSACVSSSSSTTSFDGALPIDEQPD
jgi:hypothetical protein